MYVLLAASQAKERSALQQLLAFDSELCLVGQAGEANELLAQLQSTRPNVVLLEWELPGLGGASLVSALKRLAWPPKVVAFGERMGARQEALAAGVDAFVSKEQPVEEMLNTVRAVGRLSPCFV
jgi:DNA-binding NarL/FixJ family response regulator